MDDPRFEGLPRESAAGFLTAEAAEDAGLVQHTECQPDVHDVVPNSNTVCRRVWVTPTSIPWPNQTATARAASRPQPTRTPPESVTIRGFAFLCYDISANYRTFSHFGHEEALDHVQNFMNLETDAEPYIRPSDAAGCVENCR